MKKAKKLFKGTPTKESDVKQEIAQTVFVDKPLELKSDDVIMLPGKPLGKGAFKSVHRATCFGTEVAVSVLSKVHISEKEREELVNEMTIMKKKNHTNLVSFLGYIKKGEDFEIISELCDGSLQSILVDNPSFPLSAYERLSLLRDAAKGLAWLHGGSPVILHRDLKLPNILFRKIDGNYIAKIADFGLSQLRPNHSVKETYTDPSKQATPSHNPPEVLKGGEKTAKADVYAFGVCVWEAYYRKMAWQSSKSYSSLEEYKKDILVNKITLPIELSCPAPLKALILDCMSENPNLRPSFPEILPRMEEILVQLAIPDKNGRLFWQDSFKSSSSSSFLRKVPTSTLISRLYSWLGVPFSSATRPQYFHLTRIFSSSPTNSVAETDILHFGKTLSFFGPLEAKSSGLSTTIPASSHLLNVIEDVTSQPWFHGEVSTNTLASLLQPGSGSEGDYLVRYSSSGVGAFVVSRLEGDKVVNARVEREGGEWFVGRAKAKGQSLREVVEGMGLKRAVPGSGYFYTDAQLIYEDENKEEEQESDDGSDEEEYQYSAIVSRTL